MHLTIIKNGETIDHRTLGVKLLSFKKSSLTHINEYDSAEGRHGLISLGTTFDGRKLSASFLIDAVDHLDYQLKKDIVYNLFSTEDEMILIDSRQPGKQWKVKVESDFEVENVSFCAGSFEVEFISSFPYSESIGTTLDPLTFDSNLWQIGQGLSGEDVQYIHNTTSFSIYNAGDVKIDPRTMPFVIQYTGASGGLEIENLTNGDKWTYSDASNTSDTILIGVNGIRSTKNNLSIVSKTNKKLITLDKGNNQFNITGTNGSFEIKFEFRFYYA
ncbi:phage tail family protein [Metabacillus halosaccharovorans]|uniref:phage tail family protein n=1 Tax=Metabacillus halosaccharovorans TaxID=930124 RepID=UPI00203CAAE4|nr:phage tail family protein [Metabacillus halosaccharovorans]MCM3444384.1 phage tail family protein [Metabacillus halosaccharovorans]